MVIRLSKLLAGSGYDLSRLTLSAPILAHWELLGQQEGTYTRMCCSIPDRKINQFSGVRLVRTSKEGGSLFIDKVILLRDGQEVMSRSFRSALTQESPVLEVSMNMDDYAENVKNFEWSIEVIMAPANTCGIMEMMGKRSFPTIKRSGFDGKLPERSGGYAVSYSCRKPVPGMEGDKNCFPGFHVFPWVNSATGCPQRI